MRPCSTSAKGIDELIDLPCRVTHGEYNRQLRRPLRRVDRWHQDTLHVALSVDRERAGEKNRRLVEAVIARHHQRVHQLRGREREGLEVVQDLGVLRRPADRPEAAAPLSAEAAAETPCEIAADELPQVGG